MTKTIKCRINGNNIRLKRLHKHIEGKRGKWNSDSHADIVTHKDNSWPWRFMNAGDCVHIPYKYASYKQMQNSINGYTKNSGGAKFCYRSETLGLTVWCIERKGSANE